MRLDRLAVTMAFLVIDFQGFPMPDKTFAIKELAIVDVASTHESYYVAQPPCHIGFFSARHQRTIQYVTDRVHGIPWDAGYVPLDVVEKALKKAVDNADLVYIKGSDRLSFVMLLTGCPARKIVDLDTFQGIPRTVDRNFGVSCICKAPNHDNLRCAMEQSARYRDYLRHNHFFKV